MKIAATFLTLVLLLTESAPGQISTYTFSSSSETYTELTGGTVLGNNTNNFVAFNGSTTGATGPVTGTGFEIGFSFYYRDSAFTRFAVHSSGWIRLGNGTFTIGAGNANDNAPFATPNANFNYTIAALAAEHESRSDGVLSYQVVGSTPNRELVVQWKNYRRSSAASSEVINFQIRLQEATNNVVFVYGTFSNLSGTADPAVGLRGSSNSIVNEVKNRTSPNSDWSTTFAGTANTDQCGLNSSTVPSSGLTFTWSPPAQTFSSSTTEQNTTTSVVAGSADQEIISVKVVMSNSGNPLAATAIAFNTSGTTSTADITSAKLFFTGQSNTFATTTQLGSTVNNPDGSFSFSGFSQLLGGGSNYFWLAYNVSESATGGNLLDAQCNSVTVNGNAETPTVQSPTGSRTIVSRLSGTYAVGSSQTYTTLTDAIADLDLKGVSAPVVFQLTDASYASETFPITIEPFVNASASNTLTIRPANGVTSSISGSSSSALIVLSGADYVVIDGSNNGTASRDLTLTNTSTSTSSAVIWGQTTSGSDAATNNTIKNVNVVGNSNTETLFGIGFGGTSISTSSTGTSNNDNTIQNCNISKTQYGIYSSGASSGSKNSGNVIKQNLMNTVSPNNIRMGGIVAVYEDSITITQNSISGIFVNTGSDDAFGISLGAVPTTVRTDVTPGGDYVTNATVTRNTIGTIVRDQGQSAVGIYLAGSGSGINTIANNLVSGVKAHNQTSPYLGCGIYLAPGGGATTRLYYNSVSMTGSLVGDQLGYALALRGSSPVPVVDLKNNIFHNIQEGLTSGSSFAIAVDASSYTNITSDYNILYTSGTDAQFAKTGGISSGTQRANLTAWQTETGLDANSESFLPDFTSTTDLHLNVGSVNHNYDGTPISGITIDFDGDTRDPLLPYIGADEVLDYPLPITLGSFTAQINPNGPGVLLEWMTHSEINNYGFYVERRRDNEPTFTTVSDLIPGAGTTTEPQYYSWIDNTLTQPGIYTYRLRQQDLSGAITYSWEETVDVTTLAVGDEAAPREFRVFQNYPNPFNPSTTITFSVEKLERATVSVYNILGQEVMRLFDGVAEPGRYYDVELNGSVLGNGVYFYRVSTQSRSEVKKMVMVK